jgi:hypothetical protein
MIFGADESDFLKRQWLLKVGRLDGLRQPFTVCHLPTCALQCQDREGSVFTCLVRFRSFKYLKVDVSNQQSVLSVTPLPVGIGGLENVDIPAKFQTKLGPPSDMEWEYCTMPPLQQWPTSDHLVFGQIEQPVAVPVAWLSTENAEPHGPGASTISAPEVSAEASQPMDMAPPHDHGPAQRQGQSAQMGTAVDTAPTWEEGMALIGEQGVPGDLPITGDWLSGMEPRPDHGV